MLESAAATMLILAMSSAGKVAMWSVLAIGYAYIEFYGLKGHVVRSVPDAEISAGSSRAGRA